jgi:hypothetical protein
VSEIAFTYTEVRWLIDEVDARLMREHARGGERNLALIADLDALLFKLHQAARELGPQRNAGAVATLVIGPPPAGKHAGGAGKWPLADKEDRVPERTATSAPEGLR